MLGIRWIITLGLLASTVTVATAATPEADAMAKIQPAVVARMERDGQASVVVSLREQCDLSAAAGIADEAQRGWFVYRELRRHARLSQRALRRALRAQHVRSRSFWIANALTLRAPAQMIADIAARDDVGRIESDAPVAGIDDPITAEFPRPRSLTAIEWGVSNIRAPQVWALGFTGQGIVVADQDTGFQWDHPALLSHYRGWNGTVASHAYNWHDSIHSNGGVCGANSAVPCDDHGHGTHTIGSAVGYDGATNQIGVAPGARWIGCRNMDRGTGTPSTYMECFQFFLAPTDQNGMNPDPTLRPHVMNNSWACPASEGCATSTLQAAVEAAEAAGIFVEVSTGNSGSNCSTIVDPPALYAASFSIGAYDISNVLAAFSSRGPVLADASGRRKPDISAPGVNVRSSWPTNTYANLSGTSMAGPHVTGAVALLWEARPQLRRDIATTKTVLQNSANPSLTVNPPQTCGGIASSVIPNNSFGYGRLDVLAAVNSVPALTPTSTGTATATATTSATATVTPTASQTATPTVTSTSSITPTASDTATVTVTPSVTATPTPTPSVLSSLSGTIRYFNGAQAIAGATLQLQGPLPQQTPSDSNGAYLLNNVEFGAWSIVPTKSGGTNSAITALDAVYVLQIAVGIIQQPTLFQLLAADVSGNGTVTALDASLILQYRVNLIATLPLATTCGSDWLFVANPTGGGQAVAPQISAGMCHLGSIDYSALAMDATQQDFTALVIGDVSGDWSPGMGGGSSAVGANAHWSHAIPGARGLTRQLRLSAAANAVESEFFIDPQLAQSLSIRRAHGNHGLLAYSIDRTSGRIKIAIASADPLPAGEVIAIARSR